MRALSLVLASILAVTSATSAFAEPSAADKETARGLMSDGREKRDKGDHKGALEAFRSAHKIMGVPTTGLEVGREEAALGMLIEARDTLLAVTRVPVKPGEPEPFAKAREEAEKLADAIAPRIPSAKLIVKNLPPNATPSLTIDGAEVSAAVLGVARKFNPGSHDVVVRAGSAEQKASFSLNEGEARDVEIDFGGAVPVATKPPAVETPKTRSLSPLAVTGFVITGVGLVAGGVTGGLHLSKTSSLKQQCPDGRCGPETHDDYDSARTLGTISTISFAVAGVGAVISILGLLSSGSTNEVKTSGGPHVTLAIGGTGASILGTF